MILSFQPFKTYSKQIYCSIFVNAVSLFLAGISTRQCQHIPQTTRRLTTAPWVWCGGSSCTPDSTTCISESRRASESLFLLNIKELWSHTSSSLSPTVSFWLHLLKTSGQISSPTRPASPAPRACGPRGPGPIQRCRWTLREGRSWTRRSWTGIGWTGCTRCRGRWFYSASSTFTPPSAASSWWWWPCWCCTCEYAWQYFIHLMWTK